MAARPPQVRWLAPTLCAAVIGSSACARQPQIGARWSGSAACAADLDVEVSLAGEGRVSAGTDPRRTWAGRVVASGQDVTHWTVTIPFDSVGGNSTISVVVTSNGAAETFELPRPARPLGIANEWVSAGGVVRRIVDIARREGTTLVYPIPACNVKKATPAAGTVRGDGEFLELHVPAGTVFATTAAIEGTAVIDLPTVTLTAEDGSTVELALQTSVLSFLDVIAAGMPAMTHAGAPPYTPGSPIAVSGGVGEFVVHPPGGGATLGTLTAIAVVREEPVIVERCQYTAFRSTTRESRERVRMDARVSVYELSTGRVIREALLRGDPPPPCADRLYQGERIPDAQLDLGRFQGRRPDISAWLRQL